MTTTGIKPGDAVLVIERRGDAVLAYNALVGSLSMDEAMAGTHGEPAIRAVFMATDAPHRYTLAKGLPTVEVTAVVHISHRDFVEERVAFAYEEVPGVAPLKMWTDLREDEARPKKKRAGER
jgi:hypothetical protein